MLAEDIGLGNTSAMLAKDIGLGSTSAMLAEDIGLGGPLGLLHALLKRGIYVGNAGLAANPVGCVWGGCQNPTLSNHCYNRCTEWVDVRACAWGVLTTMPCCCMPAKDEWVVIASLVTQAAALVLANGGIVLC
jgi:hypothetical protein